MRKINCYIIDDEQHARNLLEHYILKDDRLTFIGASNNASNFTPEGKEIDLLFLDIEMPGINGIEFLKKHQPPFKTIITTAFRQFAIDGYELGVTDYLLKPILINRFEKAIDSVIREETINEKAEKFDQLEAQKDLISLKSGTKTVSLSPKEITYIEAKGEYISVNTINNRFVVYMRMKEVEEQTHFNNLVRIHRSFIINPNFITERTSEYVKITDVQLPVGRSYKNYLKSILEH